MNADRLFELYERVSEAPDAIARLRRFILGLAVRGKLVVPSEEGESAIELLEQIAVLREQLIKSKSIRKPKPLEPIAEPPFAIPSSWHWIRLGEAAELIRGISFPASAKSNEAGAGRIACFRSGNIQAETVWDDFIYVPEAAVKRPDQMVQAGDLLISIANSYALVGKCSIVDEVPYPATFGAFLAAIRLHLISPSYAKAFLTSDFSSSAFREGSSQTTNIANITFSMIRSHPFAVPPLAEQRRIVAKVEELMALLDRLEAARTEREATRDRLTTASLTRLTAPDNDPEAFPNHARFALDALPALTTRPDQIDVFRQSVLSLAMRGLLVDQLSSEGSAHEAVMDSGASETGKSAFSLPESWLWVDVGSVAETRLGKMLDKGKNKGVPRPYLRNLNVRWFDFDLSDLLEMRFEESELEKFSLRKGDVLICEGGEPGRAAVWDARASEIYFQKAIHRVRFEDFVDSRFFVLSLKSAADEGRLAESFTGTGIKHFTGKGLRSFKFPLPPISEQRRIVEKVDVLMDLCDQLEAALKTINTTRASLLEALIHESLNSSSNKKEAA